MKKRKYTLKQKRVAKKYWKLLQTYMDGVYKHIRQLEAGMQMESGIEDIEFKMWDNDYIGIGVFGEEYPLLQEEEL